MALEPAEKLFLNLLADYRVEDLRDAIARSLDLARVVQQELEEYLPAFREAAGVYLMAHPERKKGLNDGVDAAKNVVQWLKSYRPDLAVEIENYARYPTAWQLGFAPVGTTAPLTVQTQEHVGFAWVAMNLLTLRELLVG